LHNILTVIPARGGSKSIPKKNLQLINGKSLIERAVTTCLKIEGNRIIVSTDDPEISNTVKKYPVEVFNRSKVNSSDIASSESVVLEVLQQIKTYEGLVVLFQATCPFTDLQAFKDSISFLQNSNSVDSMFSAVSKNEFIWEFSSSWKPVNHSKLLRPLRQFRSPIAVETGSFYIFNSAIFLEEKTRFCGVTIPAFTKNWSNFDIDSQDDLDLCRALSQILDFPPYLV